MQCCSNHMPLCTYAKVYAKSKHITNLQHITHYSLWYLFFPLQIADKFCHSHKQYYVLLISRSINKIHSSISSLVMCSWRKMPCAGISSGSPWPLKTCWRSSRLSAQASAASRQSTSSPRSWRGLTQRGRTSMKRCTSTSLSEPNWGESETLSTHHQQPLLLEYSSFSPRPRWSKSSWFSCCHFALNHPAFFNSSS